MIAIACSKQDKYCKNYFFQLNLFFLVYSYIVNHHCAGKDRVVDPLSPAPVSSYSHIKQQMEPFIKWPSLLARAFIFESKIEIVVYINTVLGYLPFQGIDMKI